MTAISGTEIGYLRAGGHSVRRYLSLPQMDVVATARMNQAVFTSPFAELTVDTTSADWLTAVKAGMTVFISASAGTHSMGVYRVRKGPGTTTLYINEISDGESGLVALQDLAPLSDNAYITVVKDYSIWSVFPKITYSGAVDVRTGVFFKDTDLAYTDQNEDTPPPVLNLGDHRAIDLVETGGSTASFAFSASSVQWVGSVDNYLWDIDGGTATVGTITDQNLTIEFTEGHYVVSCVVELDTGAYTTARRHVFVHGPTYRPLEVGIPTTDRRDGMGRRMAFATLDDIDPLLDGCMALYWESASFNGNTVTAATTQFAGFLSRSEGNAEQGITEGGFELISAMELCQNITAFSQQLTVANVPATWNECTSSLCYLDFWLFYILHYHTTILTLFDYNVLNQTTYHQAWSAEPGNFYDQLNESCKRLVASIGQTSSGALYVIQDYNLLAEAARTRVPRMELTTADIVDVQWQRNPRQRVGKVNASGFSYDGTLTPLLSQAMGSVGGQGSQTDSLENQLVDDQADLNTRASNYLAKVNNPYGDITVTLAGNYDVFEAARGDLVTLTLSETYWPQGGISRDCIVKAVSVKHEENGAKIVAVTLEAETTGYNAPAQTKAVHLPASGNAPYLTGNSYVPLDVVPIDATTGLLDYTYDPFEGFPALTYPPPNAYDPVDEAVPQAGWALAWFEAQEFTATGLNDDPDWTASFDETPTEIVASVIHSSASPFLTNVNDALWAWVLTDAGLYFNDDAFGAGTWDLQEALVDYTLLRHAPGVSGGGGIVAFRQAEDGSTPVKVAFSEDFGATVLETTVFGGETGDTGGDIDDFNNIIIVAANSKIFISIDDNVSYDEITGLTGLDGSTDISCIRIPYRKLATQVLNNSATALQFLYGTRAGVSGATLWAVTLNTSTLVIAAQVDITPTIDGAIYKVDSAEGLEAFGGDTRIIQAMALGSPPIVWFNTFDGDNSQGTYTLSSESGLPTVDEAEGIVYKEETTDTILGFDDLSFITEPIGVTGAKVSMRLYRPANPSQSRPWELRFKLFDGGGEVYNDTQSGTETGSVWFDVDWDFAEISGIVKAQFRAVGVHVSDNDIRVEIDKITIYGEGTATVHDSIRTTDGGATWELMNTAFDGTFVRFIPPDKGGDGSLLSVAGPDGIGYSSDSGETIEDKLGDFGDTQAKGAYGFG